MKLICNGAIFILFVAFISPLFVSSKLSNENFVGKKNYFGYKLLHVNITEFNKAQILGDLQVYEVDIWSRNTILVSPGVVSKVEKLLEKHLIHYSIISDNVQKLIEEENENNSFDDGWKTRRNKRQEGEESSSACPPHRTTLDFIVRKTFNVSKMEINNYDDAFRDAPLHFYLTYCQIQVWLNEMAKRHSEVISLHNYGYSYENRSLVVVKISLSTNDTIQKPIIWLEGGIHAREWISVSTSLYLVHLLSTKYTSDANVKNYLKKYDYYIVPLFNPDGYEYSFSHDRFWRKTRCLTIAPKCRGVDANRNFNFHWASCKEDKRRFTPQCLPTYPGKRAFSEPETHNFSRYFWSIRRFVKVYMSLHSFGNFWFIPYGYSSEKPKDYDQLLLVSERATEEISKLHGVKYEVGTPGDIIYFACGGSFDWIKGRAGVKYSFTMEIGNETSGFTLPPRFIRTAGQEVHTGLATLLEVIEVTDQCWIRPSECDWRTFHDGKRRRKFKI